MLGAQAEQQGQQAQGNDGLPSAIAAGAEAIGLDSAAERTLAGLLMLLLGAAAGRFAWVHRPGA